MVDLSSVLAEIRTEIIVKIKLELISRQISIQTQGFNPNFNSKQ